MCQLANFVLSQYKIVNKLLGYLVNRQIDCWEVIPNIMSWLLSAVADIGSSPVPATQKVN